MSESCCSRFFFEPMKSGSQNLLHVAKGGALTGFFTTTAQAIAPDFSPTDALGRVFQTISTDYKQSVSAFDFISKGINQISGLAQSHFKDIPTPFNNTHGNETAHNLDVSQVRMFTNLNRLTPASLMQTFQARTHMIEVACIWGASTTFSNLILSKIPSRMNAFTRAFISVGLGTAATLYLTNPDPQYIDLQAITDIALKVFCLAATYKAVNWATRSSVGVIRGSTNVISSIINKTCSSVEGVSALFDYDVFSKESTFEAFQKAAPTRTPNSDILKPTETIQFPDGGKKHVWHVLRPDGTLFTAEEHVDTQASRAVPRTPASDAAFATPSDPSARSATGRSPLDVFNDAASSTRASDPGKKKASPPEKVATTPKRGSESFLSRVSGLVSRSPAPGSANTTPLSADDRKKGGRGAASDDKGSDAAGTGKDEKKEKTDPSSKGGGGGDDAVAGSSGSKGLVSDDE